jgi:hypothetical protein
VDTAKRHARADAGDTRAAGLEDLLTGRRDPDAVRYFAILSGEPEVARVLAELLVIRGELDELRARADAGDRFAGARLPGLRIEQGRAAEADRLHRFGLNPDGSIACA